MRESEFRSVVSQALEIDPDLSQIWLVPGRVPFIKNKKGDTVPLQGQELLAEDVVNSIVTQWLKVHNANKGIKSNGKSVDGNGQDSDSIKNEIDLSVKAENIRWRVNLSKYGRSWFIAARRLGDLPWSLQKIGYTDEEIERLFSRLKEGLVVIGGPTGVGKSTTLAGLASYLSERHNWMFTSAEKPVEYIIPDNRGLVVQREVEIDTSSFHSALVATMRQTPNCIILGECREAKEMDICLNAATTGHLVLTTLHATDLEKIISRIVGMFKADERSVVREALASCLQLVIVQELVPLLREDGRKMLWEAVKGGPDVSGMIRNGLENNLKNCCTEQKFRLIKHQLKELADNGEISSKHLRESDNSDAE